MTNLYDETVKSLEEHRKTIYDIMFVVGDGHEIPLDNFIEVAKATDYYEGYGHANIPLDLRIVGNGWWLERDEYNGSEWWSFKTLPRRPGTVRRIIEMDDGLYIHEKGAEQ